MPKELVYTSAIKGLKQGTRGFCTVAASPGIPLPLQTLLESLSGYRHLYPPNTPDAQKNPVIYSHLTIPGYGSGSHLISRIADAGLDYSGRTNKIAHHLLLDDGEILRSDPVFIFSGGVRFYTQWKSDPLQLIDPRPIPSDKKNASVCTNWQNAAGDSGFAALLAGTSFSGRSVSIIYRHQDPILTLFLEALALLPYDRRWQMTFSTNAVKLPPGIRCQWRAALAQTPEETYVRSISDALLIDLTASPVLTNLLDKDSKTYLDSARSGKMIAKEESERKIIVTRVPLVSKRTAVDTSVPKINSKTDNGVPDNSERGFLPAVNSSGPSQNQAIDLLNDIYDKMGNTNPPKHRGVFFSLLILLLLTIITGLVYFYFFKSKPKPAGPKEKVMNCIKDQEIFAYSKIFFQNIDLSQKASGWHAEPERIFSLTICRTLSDPKTRNCSVEKV